MRVGWVKRPPDLTLDRPIWRVLVLWLSTSSRYVGLMEESMLYEEVSAPQGRPLKCDRIQPGLHAGTDVISLAVHYTFRLFQMSKSDSLYYSQIDRSIIYL